MAPCLAAMPAHIGIVGCSAEGAALCYRTLCSEGAATGQHDHPEITLHTPPLSAYVACLDRGDLEGVAALMRRSAEILVDAGADILICPDNTIHQAWDRAVAGLTVPWLHIADAVAEAAVAAGYRRLGILGTRWLVESGVYPATLSRHGIECVLPEEGEREDLHALIMQDLVPGRFSQNALEAHRTIVAALADRGCDAVVMGCTEIPILFDGNAAALPLLDSTRLLARAALARAGSLRGQAVSGPSPSD